MGGVQLGEDVPHVAPRCLVLEANRINSILFRRQLSLRVGAKGRVIVLKRQFGPRRDPMRANPGHRNIGKLRHTGPLPVAGVKNNVIC